MAPPISRNELRQAIDANEVTVVETLRSEHFAEGHIPGAIHIHFEDITHRAPEVLPDKDAAIVTYCTNTACRNSDIAANQLTAMGYTRVRRYAEGKEDWRNAGFALDEATSPAEVRS